jgi:hypothetical protein
MVVILIVIAIKREMRVFTKVVSLEDAKKIKGLRAVFCEVCASDNSGHRPKGSR